MSYYFALHDDGKKLFFHTTEARNRWIAGEDDGTGFYFAQYFPYSTQDGECTLVMFEDKKTRDWWVAEEPGFPPLAIAFVVDKININDPELVYNTYEEIENEHPEWFYYRDEEVAGHHVSSSCGGTPCAICGDPSTHKVGEEIMHDDPDQNRHNLTAYVCCACFRMILGNAVPCKEEK